MGGESGIGEWEMSGSKGTGSDKRKSGSAAGQKLARAGSSSSGLQQFGFVSSAKQSALPAAEYSQCPKCRSLFSVPAIISHAESFLAELVSSLREDEQQDRAGAHTQGQAAAAVAEKFANAEGGAASGQTEGNQQRQERCCMLKYRNCLWFIKINAHELSQTKRLAALELAGCR
jgi:hypothetical protein